MTEFNSFMIRDDNGIEHSFTVNYVRSSLYRKKECRHSKKNQKSRFMSKTDGAILGEITDDVFNRNLRTNLVRRMQAYMMPSYYHVSKETEIDMKNALKELGLRLHKNKIYHKKAIKYRKKNNAKLSSQYKLIELSKTTLRNILRYGSKYGKLKMNTLTILPATFDIVLEANNDSLFEHLYLYNNKTKESISIKNYINLVIMTHKKKQTIKNFMSYNTYFTDDMCNGCYIAVLIREEDNKEMITFRRRKQIDF